LTEELVKKITVRKPDKLPERITNYKAAHAFKQGVKAHGKGQSDTAMTWLNKALALNPTQPELVGLIKNQIKIITENASYQQTFDQAEKARRRGQWDTAVQYYEQAKKLIPANASDAKQIRSDLDGKIRACNYEKNRREADRMLRELLKSKDVSSRDIDRVRNQIWQARRYCDNDRQRQEYDQRNQWLDKWKTFLAQVDEADALAAEGKYADAVKKYRVALDTHQAAADEFSKRRWHIPGKEKVETRIKDADYARYKRNGDEARAAGEWSQAQAWYNQAGAVRMTDEIQKLLDECEEHLNN
jgi:tetratricopeptide (TPR) repeat protein